MSGGFRTWLKKMHKAPSGPFAAGFSSKWDATAKTSHGRRIASALDTRTLRPFQRVSNNRIKVKRGASEGWEK